MTALRDLIRPLRVIIRARKGFIKPLRIVIAALKAL